MTIRAAFARLSGLLLLTAAPVYAQGIAVFHSPNDSGVNEGLVAIESAGSTTLHLYLDAGLESSAGPEPCCAGEGDEVLGWNLTLAAAEGLAIASVVPIGDVVMNQTPTHIVMNGGEFQRGNLGPTKVADIEVQTNESGALSLTFGEVVGPSLVREELAPRAIVRVPEPSLVLSLTLGVAWMSRLLMLRTGIHRTSSLHALH